MSRSGRLRWGIALVGIAGIGLVTALAAGMLMQNPFVSDNWFNILFWLALGLAALLAAVVLAALGLLTLNLLRGRFGTRLLGKLALIFALVGLLPGALLYAVSMRVVLRNVDAWFDTQVGTALNAGLALGKESLDALAADQTQKTRGAAERFAERRQQEPQLYVLGRIREELGADTVALVTGSGTVTAVSSVRTALQTARPSSSLLQQARISMVASQIEGLDEAPPGADTALVRTLAVVPSVDTSLAADTQRLLMVVRPLPATLVANALLIQDANRDYQQRMVARDGLRRVYIAALTLTLVLSVFGALLLAAVLGNQLARPLLWLAEGMRSVAAGDLQTRPGMESSDEIAELTRSFASMTEQLGSARQQAQRSMLQLDSARTRLQTILDNLTAGVLVMGAQGVLETANPGATRILRLPLGALLGRPLRDLADASAYAQWLDERFAAHEAQPEVGEREEWQEPYDWPGPDGKPLRTLLVRGAWLPDGVRLVVFDDITEIVSAQRTAAWGEVARRVAHEIKNPLTPIQLSAERLAHKLEGKLAENDRSMLRRSVDTIVAQVQALKQMVNEFRDYARLPTAKVDDVDLNALVSDVLGLYADAVDRGQLNAQLQRDLPLIRGDASQLRQVVHNLVQNALDAVEGRDHPQVGVSTQLSSWNDASSQVVRLIVTDNGPGFDESVLKRAFEPYVTTKAKGTGLGLAVVRKIADEHAARVRIVNRRQIDRAVEGAQVSLSFSSFHTPDPRPGTPTT